MFFHHSTSQLLLKSNKETPFPNLFLLNQLQINKKLKKKKKKYLLWPVFQLRLGPEWNMWSLRLLQFETYDYFNLNISPLFFLVSLLQLET